MQFIKKVLLLTIVVITFTQIAYSQNKANTKANKSIITGKILDGKTNESLPYVSVAILRVKDSTLINGGITNDKGIFTINNVNYGKYILRCSFVGYKDYFQKISVNSPKTTIDDIKISVSSETLDAVNITAERQMMEYKLDKRVINVDKNLVATGGTASDILDNVPSVQVDDEGNLTLRGNSNVTLLVDGKPSQLLGNDIPSVLAQIPASSVESIEVITNPSAKYNPEGMSGIINIKLKEKGNRGLNGNVNVTAGSAVQKYMPRDNFSAALNWSNKKFALSASIDGNYSERGRKYDNFKYITKNDSLTDVVRSTRDGSDQHNGIGARLGADWYINPKNTLSLSFNTHYHKSPSENGIVYNTNLFDSMSYRTNKQTIDGSSDGHFNNLGLTYSKTFKLKDEEFYANVTWNWGNFNNSSNERLEYYNTSIPTYVRDDEGTSKFHRAVADIHYIYPFSKDSKLEVGYNLEYSKGLSSYDYYLNGNSFVDTATSYDFHSESQIHALYATFGFMIGQKLSTQLGLRGEMVKNDFNKDLIVGYDTKFNKDYNSIYPTIHISYQITPKQSVQLSYSRRIRRPDAWTLLPNIDVSNPEYVRFGNPNIDPEYTDAYEAGYSIMLKKTTIYSSLYYRATNNEMTRFEFYWDQANCHNYGFDWAWDIAGGAANSGRIAQTTMNLAHCFNYGLELIIDQEITKWWKANISGNFFGQEEDGTELNYSKVNTINWNAKLTSTMTLPKDLTIQLSGQYYAPQTTIQGHNNASYFADLAIRKNILNKQGTIALNVRDIFNTRSRDGYSFTDQYVSFNHRKPYSQSVSVSFSYRFGQTQNMKKKVKQQMDNNNNSYGGNDSDDI